LNAGFRLPLSNGSDHPARVVGCVRAYVKIDGEFSYRGWIDGLRKKRSFVTSGPLLLVTVNDAGIGEEVQVKQGEDVTIRVQAISRRPIGRVQIVSNSEVLKEQTIPGHEGKIEFTMKADKSRWVVARCSDGKGWDLIENTIVKPGRALTAAVYVLVDGKRIFDLETAEGMAQRVQSHGKHIEKNALFENDEQRKEAVDVFVKADEAYQRLMEGEEK
jgi:hypothetical protein